MVVTVMVCVAIFSERFDLELFLAWVMGAADPTSGTVSLHEVIKGLGALLKRGWTPLRTSVSIEAWLFRTN